jgi:hypothetical protein
MRILSTPITQNTATALQIQKLGFQPGSEVWIKVNNNQPYRCLVTKDWGLDATKAVNPKDANGNPRLYPEDGNKIWEATGKHYPNGVAHFQRLAKQGHQIFVIPNRVEGGIRAADVQQCQHIFAEADDRPISEQWERLQWFSDVTGLVPCLVVYSGGKSLHFYFALESAIAPEDWQRLQRKIILIFRSDPQIQNLNREMRLAGVSRKDKQVSVDFTSDHRYDPIEFEQRLDSLGYFPHGLTYERWLKGRKLLKDKAPDAELLKLLAIPEDELFPKAAPQPPPSREFNYTGDTIPLEVCLTRDDQELIAHGVIAGSVGRNPMAYKLACNAIGTAAVLNSLGIQHSDNGYQLLEDFCHHCYPPLPDREVQRLWKQAQKINPKPSLTDEQLLKRVSYWQWKQRPPTEQRRGIRKFNYATSVQTLQASEEPDSSAYAAYIAWEEEEEQNGGLKTSEPTAEDLWKLLHVPDAVQYTQRLALSDEELQAEFLCIKSPMGSGKTYKMAQICASAKSLLIVVNTIALGEALALGYNCVPYNDPKIKAGELRINDIDRLVITSESLWKITTFNKKFDVVLIDEADQVLSSAVASATTRRKRKEILTNLEYFAHQSQRFVLMDADLSSPVVEFGHYLCDRKPYIVQNASIPHHGETFYQFESQEAHIAHICDHLEWDNKVLVVTDSKKKVKALGAYLNGLQDIEGVENLNLGEELYEKFQRQFPDKKGAIIHGDNSGKDEIRKLIKHINKLLPILKLDYLIFNSCVQSGVSIEVIDELGQGYFQTLSCLFTGMTLPHTELGQISHRWRLNDCEKSFSFSQAPTFNLETSVTKLERDLFAKHWEEAQSLGINAKTGMPDPEITKFRVQVEARRNWSLNNIQEAFKRHLEGMGYEIAPHPNEALMSDIEKFKEALKSRGQLIDQALIATIINSPLIDQKGYDNLKKKPNPDYYDRAMQIRYEFNDFTGMEPSEKLVKTWLEDDIRKKLTRLDFLFQPKQAAKIADLANRRKCHYVFDQRYNLLERELLEVLDAKAYFDPTKVYATDDLKPLEAACKKHAAKIKRLFGVTIYQPPKYLKRGLKEATEGIQALFDASVHPLAKWLLGTLSTANFVAFTKDEFKETFKEQESATNACKQLSKPGQILCEALSVATRHRVSDMSPSKVHAALCEAVGLKREQAYQNASGRGYRIKPESWAFAQAVLEHRQWQREDRRRQNEEAILKEAARFTADNINEQQQVIEQEIGDAIASTSIPPSPNLVYSHTPPEIYRSNNLGGVCYSQGENSDEQEYSFQPVTIGDEISIPCLAETGRISAIAPGQDAQFNLHDYIRFVPHGGGAKWIPIAWAQSPDGKSIRLNPVPDPNFIPLRTRQIWANWLLAMTDSNQLINFERRHTLTEIEGAISTLKADQLLQLQHKFAAWGIDRTWLPPFSYTHDLVSVLKLGLEMGLDTFKGYLGDLKQSFDSLLLRRTWQSLSRELKAAIATLAPEAPGMLILATEK